MKNTTKRFFTFLMAMCMIFATAATAFAAAPTANTTSVAEANVETVRTYLNESEQDIDVEAFLAATSDDNLQLLASAIDDGIMPLLDEGSVTLYASNGLNQDGSFSMTNPGYPFKTTYVSYDLITPRVNDWAQMQIISGKSYTTAQEVTKSTSPVHDDFPNSLFSRSTMTVNYWACFRNTYVGEMTLKCWAWVL